MAEEGVMAHKPDTGDVVADPVGHISISGVHGREELDDRLAHARKANRRTRGTGSIGPILFSAALGAAVMYLFDPVRGKRRRSLLRDRMIHAVNIGADRLGKTGRHVRNRAGGAIAEARGRLRDADVDSVVIADRVRAALGRVVSHPSSIVVGVAGGEVTLGGPVLADEVDALLASVGRVRGVDSVVNAMEIHARAGNVPGLQDAAR